VNFHTLTLMENTLIKCLLFSLLWVLQYKSEPSKMEKYLYSIKQIFLKISNHLMAKLALDSL